MRIIRPFASLLLLISCISTGFAQTALPTPDPVAAGQTAAAAAAKRIRTLEELQEGIRTRLSRSELTRGQVGVKIVSLSTGKVVYEQNSDKYFMPASNMKNFTVATAIERLSPDYRFVTSVYAAQQPDMAGTIKGDLRVYGRGDVSISTAFFSPEPSPAAPAAPDPDRVYYAGLDKLVEKITAAGVKRVEGSIIGDDTYFKGQAVPDTWEWDDLQSYYGTEVSALPLNDSAVDLWVKPGPSGYGCTVKISPFNPVYRVRNTCLTTPAGTPRTLRVQKLLGQNVLEVSGTLPVGNAGLTTSIAVTRPAELFAALLKQRLERAGITVTGQHRVETYGTSKAPEPVEIARLESPPLALIAAKTMKPSQNMYTETLLWTLGEEARKKALISAAGPQPDSAALGRTEVKSFLTGIGIPDDAVVQYDGSGLSRHNLITPSAVVQLYTYMAKQSKYTQAWRDSLTIGGVDGTLRNRFKGTAAEGNMRGKTGTIDQVSALSGYLTTAGGEQLVVSFIVNGIPTTGVRTGLIDDIVVNLASFNGKIDQLPVQNQ